MLSLIWLRSNVGAKGCFAFNIGVQQQKPKNIDGSYK